MNAPAGNRHEQALEQGFQLGELWVDPLAGEVSGPGGRLKLDPKVMSVLVMLAQRAGQVVLREDLMARLWPNAVVTDDALSRCIYEMRQQLSQAGGDPQYRTLLETVPKRGYRLNGNVTALKPGSGAPPRGRATRLVLVAALAVGVAAAVLLWFNTGRQASEPAAETSSPPPAVAGARSIAVLPFLDLSEGQDQGYLADGIAEEILNRLAQAENLRVIARTSSFAFRGKPTDVREIAAKLDVSHVLEGSIRRSGDGVRITAQLIAASDNSHVWSETMDRNLGELFAVQDEIAASVATALQIAMVGGATHGRMPASVEAFEQFLQGEFVYHRRAPGDIERSVKYYEEAIVSDPGYARAWASLAGAYSLLELRDKQGEAARKAVALDPQLAVAHARMAQFYYNTGELDQGDVHSREAAALDPGDPLVLGFSAARALFRGDLTEAVATWRRLAAQDPLSAINRGNLGAMLLADGQLDEALPELRKAMELSPDQVNNQLDLVRALILLEHHDEAEAAIARLPEGAYRDFGLAMLYARPDRLAAADAALARLAAPPVDTQDSVRLAEAYAFRGMGEKAFAVLRETRAACERLHAQKPKLAWNFIEELRLSPFLKPLHADPRWPPLVATPT